MGPQEATSLPRFALAPGSVGELITSSGLSGQSVSVSSCSDSGGNPAPSLLPHTTQTKLLTGALEDALGITENTGWGATREVSDAAVQTSAK